MGGDHTHHFLKSETGESKMPTWKDRVEAHHFMDYVFFAAARIVSDGVQKRIRYGEYEWVLKGREWFNQQRIRHQLHPAVFDMMTEHKYRAEDWQQLLLEWPHKALTDPNRIAYTRNEQSAMHNGNSDAKAVVTTIGKYLTRHFPDAPSNLIRDIGAKYTYGGSTVITKEMNAMVHAVINGPRSCMSNSFDLMCDDKKERHPYAVYDPSLGWGMAVRTDTDGMVLGRCLVHESDEGKGFVRSYKRERAYSSHSGADEAIEAYLKDLGYAKWRGWPEHIHIMRYPLRKGGFLMPYIDGGNQHVVEEDDTFRISEYNGYEASNTSGILNGYNCTCDDCGEGMDEDDSYSIGYDGDMRVGPCCIDNYSLVTGRRRREYYVRNEEAVQTQEGDWYDSDWISDNDIVELHDGDYTHSDNAVFIESCDAYYHVDDEDIIYTEDSNQYELRDDCWCCAASGNWYTDDTDNVEVDGETYHPDHAPESDDEDEDETETATTTDTTPTI
jgi:hypothetical protein